MFYLTGLHIKNYLHHGNMVHQLMIEIIKPGRYDFLDKEIIRIKEYSSIIVTRSLAVEHFFNRVQCSSDIGKIKHLKIFSIGKHTTKSLMKFGLNANFEPDEDSSKGLLNLFRKMTICCEKILIPRSNLARPFLPNELRKLGNTVHTVTAYRNVYPAEIKKLNIDFFDGIICTSPSGVDNFIRANGSLPMDREIISRGWETQKRIDYYNKSK